MKFYREKISNRNFSKKRGQNILKLAHNVEKYLKIWNLGVSIGDTFFGLTGPSQTVWYAICYMLPWSSLEMVVYWLAMSSRAAGVS